MYGTLRGALAGRKIAFDRDSFTATVDGRIVGVGKTIRIKSIHMHYELAVPAESREATERALTLHPQGCPAHQSVQGAIDVTWEARVRFGENFVTLQSQEEPGGHAQSRRMLLAIALVALVSLRDGRAARDQAAAVLEQRLDGGEPSPNRSRRAATLTSRGGPVLMEDRVGFVITVCIGLLATRFLDRLSLIG